jgi:hypothetical protein
VNSLLSFAQGLKGVKSADVTAVTMPNTAAPGDPNRLVALQPQASQLWAALMADQAVPESVLALQQRNPADSQPRTGPGRTVRGARNCATSHPRR